MPHSSPWRESFKSFSEMAAPSTPRHGDTFGPWQYNATDRTLTNPSLPGWYVDLDRTQTPADCWQWLSQAWEKTESPEAVGRLFEAMTATI